MGGFRGWGERAAARGAGAGGRAELKKLSKDLTRVWSKDVQSYSENLNLLLNEQAEGGGSTAKTRCRASSWPLSEYEVFFFKSSRLHLPHVTMSEEVVGLVRLPLATYVNLYLYDHRAFGLCTCLPI